MELSDSKIGKDFICNLNYSECSLQSTILNEQQSKCLNYICEFSTNTSWKLIYRGSRDGFSSIEFHNKCMSLANTLTVIHTKNDSIFGGFTTQTWNYDANEKGVYKKDPKAFLFSLFTKQKFPVIKSETAIFCSRHRGPSFGNDIVIDKQPHLDDSLNYCTFPNSYNSKNDKKSFSGLYLFKPDDGIKFFINDIEVFQILDY